MRFAARLVIDGFVDEAMMQRILTSQDELIERGKPMTVAQICVAKKWLTRSEARLLADPDAPPRDLIPGYSIERKLGIGGMSHVFSVRAEGGDSLALKVLKPHLVRNPQALDRFRREADLLMRLDHPNIVRGHERIEEDGLVGFTMEEVPGRELREFIEKGGPFGEDAALWIVLQIARAVEHLHSHQIVHRDIKPGNILLTTDNTVKLCDLGLAADGRDADCDEGTTVGTVEYMSPEQAMGGEGIDVRSDIYALGVTLYHLVVGEPPFQGADADETMAKRFVETLRSSKLSRVSPHTHYFIQKMMATDREMRYQSPPDLIQDIEESIRGKKTLTQNPLSAGAESLELQKPFADASDPRIGSGPRPGPRRRR